MALTEQEHLYLENALEQVALAEAAAQALHYSYQRRPEVREGGTGGEGSIRHSKFGIRNFQFILAKGQSV